MNRYRAWSDASSAPRHSRASRAVEARGFTLIEILIVVTLIAALTIILIGAMNGGMDGLKLRSNAKKLVAELRHARAQAIATGTVQRFTVVPEQRTWTGAKQHHGEFPKAVNVVFTGVRQVQAREGEGAILFFEDGASTGGRIQLRVKKAAMNVDVAWLTGEVTLNRGEVER
jgi:general secretion pathway protein H